MQRVGSCFSICSTKPSSRRSKSIICKAQPGSSRTAKRTLSGSLPLKVRYLNSGRYLNLPFARRCAAAATAAGSGFRTSSDSAWHTDSPMAIAGCFFNTLSKCFRIFWCLGRVPQFPNNHPMLPTWLASLRAAHLDCKCCCAGVQSLGFRVLSRVTAAPSWPAATAASP